jgi:hypothetical protein
MFLDLLHAVSRSENHSRWGTEPPFSVLVLSVELWQQCVVWIVRVWLEKLIIFVLVAGVLLIGVIWGPLRGLLP